MPGNDETTGAPIAVSLTLPGSASLGAFQAGAVAALAVVMHGLRANGRPVSLTAIGGSSAGSIVAMLFTHGLLTGRDVPTLMRTAWVDEVDMSVLRSGGSDAPLSFDDLRARLIEFIDDDERIPPGVHEPLDEPVRMQVGLTSLLGFQAEIDGSEDAVGLSYVDWAEFELAPSHDPAVIHDVVDGKPSLLDTVLASACHPAGFRPRLLDRSTDREAYESHGVINLPDHARLWYTDGGLVESRPVGRILRAARRVPVADDATRMHIVVDPRSSGPSGDDEWADPDADQSWLDGVRRSMSIVPTQALHDDLRGVARVNRRLRDLDDLLDELDPHVGLERAALAKRLAAWAGLDDKTDVRIEMISPRSKDGDESVTDLLAGDFVGAFGGFLDRSIRASDFALGWSSVGAWLPDALARQSVDDDLIARLTELLEGSWSSDWDDPSLEGDGVEQLDLTGRLRLFGLAGQFARVLVRAATPSVDLDLSARLSGWFGREPVDRSEHP